MLTRCPRCATMFRVTPDQLKVRRGKVRCGKCLAVFNALETLDDEPQTIWGVRSAAKKRAAAAAAGGTPAAAPEVKAPVAAALPSEPATGPEKLVFPALEPAAPPPPEPTPELAAEAPPAPTPATTSVAPPEPLPQPVTEPPAESPIEPLAELSAPPPIEQPKESPAVAPRRQRRTERSSGGVASAPVPLTPREPPWPAQSEPRLHDDGDELNELSRSRRWPWLLGIFMATVALAVQAAVYFRTALAVTLPEARPALLATCKFIGCTVDLPRKIDMIGIETSDLIFDKEKPGHLQLVATLRNRAPFAQVWPHLEVTFTDTGDHALLRRALAPAEYLPSQPPTANGIPAHGEQTVQLDLQTTDIAAVGYRLYVFYP